jgi:membrane protein DedA with SNARE-associated domain
MPEEIISLISRYGYLAIFFLIFIQEIGFPNPIPNEILLLFSGYLTFKGLIIYPFVILVAFAADFTGTSLIYLIFYFTGSLIVMKKPAWWHFPEKLLRRISNYIETHGSLGILVFRLTPFTRGYTSALTGLMQVRPGKFLPIAFLSGLLWSGAYITAGYFIGPSWEIVSKSAGNPKFLLVLSLIAGLTLLIVFSLKNKKKNQNKTHLTE